MDWFIKALKQYADFKGRARRKEYWMFILFYVLILLLAVGLDSLIGSTFSFDVPFGFLFLISFLGLIIPCLAVLVRRLHDMGKSGWFYFVRFIPLVGPIMLLVWLCTDSEFGTNKWGENPKGLGNTTAIDQIGIE